MKRYFGDRFVLPLRVAAAAWLGGALAWAALTISDEVTNQRLLVISMLVITAFCVMVAVTLSAVQGVSPAEEVSEPVPLRQPSPSERERPAPDNMWYAAAARDNAMRQARQPAPTARRTEASRKAPEQPPTMVSIPVRAHGRAGKGTMMQAAAGPTAGVLILQCPRCGDFGVDARARQPYFAFACRHCGHSWGWTDGACWPTTVVRPRLAIAHANGSSSSSSVPVQAEPNKD
jgi:predicted RNA-binding Zn-ribbon protein involved in translation (DUF1610 family)